MKTVVGSGLEAAPCYCAASAPPIQTPCLPLMLRPQRACVSYLLRAKALPLLMAAERSELPYELVFFLII